MFERFVRLDTSRARASGGSGLGLSIVQEITKAHHGTVALTAAPGGGTTATVTLPVSEPRLPVTQLPLSKDGGH